LEVRLQEEAKVVAYDVWLVAGLRLLLINHIANYLVYELHETYYVHSYFEHCFLQMLNFVANLQEARSHLLHKIIPKEQLFPSPNHHYFLIID
jgi:hypothetical protein